MLRLRPFGQYCAVDQSLNASEMNKKIIHIDMDAFYAAVEQRDDPTLRGKPVVVGGLPGGRGVVATASYEARKFGIRSAMPISTAFKLCPKAVFLKPNFPKYKAASQAVMSILQHYCEPVEAVSLDEAYLNATNNRFNVASAGVLAQAIQEHIFAVTKLTASAGVGPNKLIAKIASDYKKPSGLTVVAPNYAQAFLSPLAVEKIPGVGKTTAARLHEMGISRICDLLSLSEQALTLEFGSFGKSLYQMARGIDRREVKVNQRSKTVSAEHTFSKDLVSRADLQHQIEILSQEVARRLERKGLFGRTVSLKVKFSDFTNITRAHTHSCALHSAAEIAQHALELLREGVTLHTSVRLLGVGVSSLSSINDEQIIELEKYIQLAFAFIEAER